MSKQPGFRGKLYSATITTDETTGAITGYSLGDEIKIVRDTSVDMSADQIDVSDRDNNGWKSFISGLKDGQFTTTISLNPESTDYTSLRNAWLNGTPIGLGILFRDKEETDDNDGIVGLWTVSGWNVQQPLNDGQTVDITAGINKFAGTFPPAPETP